MKNIIFILIFAFVSPTFIYADNIVLDSTEILSTPSSTKITDWEIIQLNATERILRVKFRWRNSSDEVIRLDNRGAGWNYWTCRDIEVSGTNAECIGTEDPYPCCTGAGTGTCDDLEDSCFTDVFGFVIRSQDVGTKIGAGLRTLIWNKFKEDILSTGNDGTFDVN